MLHDDLAGMLSVIQHSDCEHHRSVEQSALRDDPQDRHEVQPSTEEQTRTLGEAVLADDFIGDEGGGEEVLDAVEWEGDAEEGLHYRPGNSSLVAEPEQVDGGRS